MARADQIDYIGELHKRFYPDLGQPNPRKNYFQNDYSGEELSNAIRGKSTVEQLGNTTKIVDDRPIYVDASMQSKIPDFISQSVDFNMPDIESPEIEQSSIVDESISKNISNVGKANRSIASSSFDMLPDLVASAGPSILALLGGASPNVTTGHFDRGNAYVQNRAKQEIPTLQNTDVYVGPDGNPVRRLIKDSEGMEKFFQSKGGSSDSNAFNKLHSVLRVEHPDGKPEFFTVNKDGSFNATGLMPDRGVTTMVGIDPEGNKIYRQGSKNFPGESREIGRTEGFGERAGFPQETMKQVQKIQDKHTKTQQEMVEVSNAADHVLRVVGDENASPNSVAAAVQNLIRMLAADTRISDMDARLILADTYKTYARQIEDWYRAKFRGEPMTPETRASIIEAIQGVLGRNSDLANTVYDMYDRQSGVYPEGSKFFQSQFGRPERKSYPKTSPKKTTFSDKLNNSIFGSPKDPEYDSMLKELTEIYGSKKEAEDFLKREGYGN